MNKIKTFFLVLFGVIFSLLGVYLIIISISIGIKIPISIFEFIISYLFPLSVFSFGVILLIRARKNVSLENGEIIQKENILLKKTSYFLGSFIFLIFLLIIVPVVLFVLFITSIWKG